MTADTIVIPKYEWSEKPAVTIGMLEGRTARCPHCKRQRPSMDVVTGDLAFFEYRGPGNRDRCDVCLVIPAVHDGTDTHGKPLRPDSYPARLLAMHPPHEYTDAIGATYDSYYCGCRGWD
jgi:hypothetical protein